MKPRMMPVQPARAYKVTQTVTGARISLHAACRPIGAEFYQYVDIKTGDIFLKRVEPIEIPENRPKVLEDV